MKVFEKQALDMIKKLQRRSALMVARVGVFFLKRSGVFNGFFSDWRWAIFDQSERLGLHILPVHYYSPVPNVSRLALDDQTPVFTAVGVETLDAATHELAALVERYGAAYSEIAHRKPYGTEDPVTDFRFGKAPYSTLEAEFLYGLIRARRPGQIVEIGSGHTTLLIAEAIRAEAHAGYEPILECIEPYRPNYLQAPPPEVTKFLETPLQSVPVERFKELQSGDILFIDSSHVVSYGSDVVYEIAVIIPKLNPGVLVHFHDIFLPYEYPSEWIQNSKFFWTEQYMLSALIQGNPRYRVKYPLHQLYRERRAEMERLFPLLSEPDHRPGAYWIEISENDQGRRSS